MDPLGESPDVTALEDADLTVMAAFVVVSPSPGALRGETDREGDETLALIAPKSD